MSLRTTPVQARSAARLADLLDACAQVVDEVGVESVTTNLVAERAGCSIGTLYRYFPDRLAVIRGLGLRQCADTQDATRANAERVSKDAAGYRELLDALADDFIRWYRGTTGSAAMGYAHVVDLPVGESDSQMLEGRLAAGPSPRDALSSEVAALFAEPGDIREGVKLDLDFATVTTFALVDRAGALERSSEVRAVADEAYAWARASIASVIDEVVARLERRLAGEPIAR